jgi:transposase InsO family protein
MRASAIRAKTVKQWRATTDSAHQYPVVPNTLNRQFAVARPNKVWAGVSKRRRAATRFNHSTSGL